MKPTCKRVMAYLENSGTWTPLHQLQHPAVGGTSAARRIRELRAEGVPIEWRHSDNPGSRCTFYRIKSAPVQMVNGTIKGGEMLTLREKLETLVNTIEEEVENSTSRGEFTRGLDEGMLVIVATIRSVLAST